MSACEGSTSTSVPPSSTTTSTTSTTTTTTTTSTSVVPVGGVLVFEVDTVLLEPLVLRAGDSVELRNGARLSFGAGAFLDAQGTVVETWSDDGGNTWTRLSDGCGIREFYRIGPFPEPGCRLFF